MLTGLIGILIWLLIFGLILYAFYYIIGLLPLPAPVKNIVSLVLGFLALIVLLEHFMGFLGGAAYTGQSLR
jgi:uncharacterized membrane protein (DUF373 family)